MIENNAHLRRMILIMAKSYFRRLYGSLLVVPATGPVPGKSTKKVWVTNKGARQELFFYRYECVNVAQWWRNGLLLRGHEFR